MCPCLLAFLSLDLPPPPLMSRFWLQEGMRFPTKMPCTQVAKASGEREGATVS